MDRAVAHAAEKLVPVAEGVSGHSTEELQALVPVIGRLIETWQPVTWRSVAAAGFLGFNESKADQLRLEATLDALGIPYPPKGATRDEWYYYLIRLRLAAMAGAVCEARAITMEE